MAILNVSVACFTVCLEKLLYFLGILKQNTPLAIFSKILFDHVFQAHVYRVLDRFSYIKTSIDNRIGLVRA